MKISSREAAFSFLVLAYQEKKFLKSSFSLWKSKENPPVRDFHLAQEIAYGTMRESLTLLFQAEKLGERGKLKLKVKEKALLLSALYQYYFCDRIPLHAITDESVKIAKKKISLSFSKFLNALLRKCPDFPLKLPEEKSPDALSIKYSYPVTFVRRLLEERGEDLTVEILKAMNLSPKIMARVRPSYEAFIDQMTGWKKFHDTPLMMILEKPESLEKCLEKEAFYIQNITPAFLIEELKKESNLSPQTILDMCASPGGKSIAVSDYYKEAQLTSNDISLEKIEKLKKNFEKYHVKATLSQSLGEDFESDPLFDLIILDVPCSNTGVLGKRPEARWRLDPKSLEMLEEIQERLLKAAKRLLSPKGQIWYMTCSILKGENEDFIQKISPKLGLSLKGKIHTILPNDQGWDGGFGVTLVHSRGSF